VGPSPRPFASPQYRGVPPVSPGTPSAGGLGGPSRGPPSKLTLTFLAIIGLIVGSFLNVVIARLPERRSLLGRSACTQCGHRIAAHDNIPLLSFIVLRGRCRACRRPISWRYPVVELATGAAIVAVHLRFGLTPAFGAAGALMAALIAVTAIDLEHQIIPRLITLPGIGMGLIVSPLTGLTEGLDAVIGVIVCGGALLTVVLATAWMSPVGGMGYGDPMLGAMLGAFLGWRLGLFALLVAVLAGGLVGAVLLISGRKGRKDPLPFGPFLALGGATALLVDPPSFLGL
jgi:leader peptidase (prepilin peptidase)/N-methyltransferase